MAITKLAQSEPLSAPEWPTWLDSLLNAIKQLRFGSVEITVHDGRIIQIERKEKLRFETPAAPKGR